MTVLASSGVEPISPELVLVDPELARAARQALPDRPWEAVAPPPRWGPPPARVAAAPEAPVAEAPVALPTPERARLWPRRAATAAVSLASLAAFVAASAGAFTDPDDRPYLAPLEAEAAEPTETVAPTAPPRTPPEWTPPLSSQVAPEGRPPNATAPGFGKGRTFAWPRYTGATYYLVLLKRGDKVVYEARPGRPEIVLPGRLRLRPGKYVWVVRAGYGVRSDRRLGPPFLRSSFQVRRG